MVWYSASYRVCVTSTLFPLRLTFLAQRSPFQDIHCVFFCLDVVFVCFTFFLFPTATSINQSGSTLFFVFLYPRIDIIIGNTILFSCFFIGQFVSQTIFDNLYFFIMCYVSTFHCIHLGFW